MRAGISRKASRRAVAVAVAVSSAATLAGCASPKMTEAGPKKRSKEYFAESIYGVKASPRVSSLRTNLPRGGGRDQTGKPYMVRGKWYYPKEERGYKAVGGASWYGDAFHGRLTANGEIYDMTHLTAAHPTMPLPSYARVTNLKNGSSVIVRVNDRGPYHSGRVVDLSRKAAEMLDYSHAGIAQVKVEYVGRAPLEGRDDRFLLASYRPGKGGVMDPSDGLPTGVMIAMNGPAPNSARKRAAPAAVPPRAPAAEMPSVATATLRPRLPEGGPSVPSRPGLDAQGRMVLSGYAAFTPPEGGSQAFAAFDRAAWGDTGFVAAATLDSESAARALAERLGTFGTASVEKEAAGAWSVELRPDGSRGTDALLEAAWANGAPDAFPVRP